VWIEKGNGDDTSQKKFLRRGRAVCLCREEICAFFLRTMRRQETERERSKRDRERPQREKPREWICNVSEYYFEEKTLRRLRGAPGERE
jgi:hypothetical protein